MLRPLLLGVALAVAPTTAAGVNMKCIDRDGRCIEATVNGQRSVKLAKQTRKLLEGLKRVSHWVADVRYELPVPIEGKLEVKADQTRSAGDWFGEQRQAEVMVVPLDDVELKARTEIAAADSVRVGGAAPLVQRHVLERNMLPAGRYLLVVRLSGTDNWDRQVLYFTAK
jgi:hypothetical protein